MKNIREFDDFEGQDGYLIVDGLTEDVSGGKKKLSDIVSEQVQADWEQDDTTAKDYIKNKPDVSNKIESISINDTEIVPDENKNVNIGLGTWLDIDSDNNLYVIPNYGGGTGGLAYNEQYGELSVKFDKTTIDRDKDDNLSVHYDDTLTIVDKPVGSLVYSYLSVKNPVPDTDEADYGDVLTYDEEDGIVWKTPLLIYDWDSKNFINRLDIGGTGGFVLEGDIVKIKCKERRGLELDDSDDGIGISVSNANDGDVLTYNGDTDEIVWAAPQGGGIQLPNIPAITTQSGGEYYIPIFVNPGTYAGHSQGYTEQTLVWKKTSEIDPNDWNFDKFESK